MNDEKILSSKFIVPDHPNISFGEWIWDSLLKFSDDHVCLIDARTDEQLTIGEIKRQANSIAVALIGKGIKKSDKISFYGENSIQHSVLRFVAYFLGNAFLPLSPTYETYEIEATLKDVDIDCVITSADQLPKFERVLSDKKFVIIFDTTAEKSNNQNNCLTFEALLEEGKDKTLPNIPYFAVNPKTDIFTMILTSGSTGQPKCAIILHSAAVALMLEKEFMFFFKLANPPIVALNYPFGHSSGTISLPMYVAYGSRVVLYGEYNEELLLKSIEKYRITQMPVFPAFGHKLVDGKFTDKYDISSLQIICVAGAAFSAQVAMELKQKFNISIIEGYGMTEHFLLTQGSDPNEEYISGNVGRVAVNTQIKIVDTNSGESLAPNQHGEICVRGNKLFAGYLTPENAIELALDKDGWFHTGDIGHYDDSKRIYITDRLKEVIRIGVDNHYINVFPVEIEQFLLTHKSIAEVAVIGVNNKSGTHWPRAYVVPQKGHSVSAKEIQKFIADTMAYSKQLKGGVVFVDRIQRTSIGKVDRKYYRTLVSHEVID